MKFLKIALLFLFVAQSACGTEVSYTRQEDASSFLTLRERVVERPLFYAEIQSYRLVENYLHYWNDRPLFHDSSLRGAQSYRNSFLRNVEVIKDYEIDGFTALSNASSLMSMYEEHLQALSEEEPYPGFSYMCGAGYSSPNDEWNARYLKNYTMAVNSPYTLRINGKIPVWAYHSASQTPEQIKALTEMLVEETSVEPILFAEVSKIDFERLYEKNGKLTYEQMNQLRQTFEDMLDECGGLMVNPTLDKRTGGDYTSKPTSDYYRNCTLPLLLDLMKQPRYKDKLIGAYVSKGYINHLSGNNGGEYGTSGFRQQMDELMLLNPDVVVLFEWNEANENTHFQPTISNAKTMQRLVKFYARKMRGQSPTPNEGDDLSIPNLVFSSRQVLRLGDTLRYELLNVPDSDSKAHYQVQLVIRDYDGKTLKAFPEETFTVSEMKAVTFELPSEQFFEHTLILPELRVTNSEGKEQTFAMQYNRIHPSVCWNYKEIMQPLRDMLRLSPEFSVDATQSSGIYEIKTKLESPETLMQVEVLDNEDEVFAVDRENRYNPEENIIIHGSFTAFSTSINKMVFEVLNAPGWQWFRECYRTKSDAPDPKVVENKVTVPDYYINFYYLYPFYITIPKAAAADAVLEIDSAQLGKHSFKVTELLELRKMATAFDGNNRLDLKIVKNLLDIPVPLQQKEAQFSTSLETESRFPIYQLRAISSSGKIYRSRPIMPLRPHGETIHHSVFSATKQQAVTVDVANDRIPELKYQFDDSCGAMLKNSWEPFFDAQLGGGFIYLEPFNRPRPTLLDIPGRSFLHPTWQELDNANVLNFDGMANYINFPREALPYGSFTLEFEIKPEGSDSQVLFRNFSYHEGSLNLYRRQGKLEASFTYRTEGIYNSSSIEKFETDLELPDDKWSKVTVSYNLRELSFAVDGSTRKYPFSERGVFFKPSVFGGHTYPVYETGKDIRFFKGQLRSLRIRHAAEPFIEAPAEPFTKTPSQYGHISIDNNYGDWGAALPCVTNAPQSVSGTDFKEMWVANDCDYLYIRYTFHTPAYPWGWGVRTYMGALTIH